MPLCKFLSVARIVIVVSNMFAVWMVANKSAYILERFEFYLFLVSLPLSLFLQLFYLNSALRQLDSLEVV